MKKQQINLYKSLPRISRNWFGEELILQASVGFGVLLILLTLMQMMFLRWDDHRLDVLQKEYIRANANFVKTQKAQGGTDLLQLQQDLVAKTKLLKLLNIKMPSAKCPFMSSYLQSLSVADTGGVWLTKFRLDPVSQDYSIDGVTYDPVLIINWIRQLGVTPCFAGVKFQAINIEKNTSVDLGNTMNFSVESSFSSSPLVQKPTSGGK